MMGEIQQFQSKCTTGVVLLMWNYAHVKSEKAGYKNCLHVHNNFIFLKHTERLGRLVAKR